MSKPLRSLRQVHKRRCARKVAHPDRAAAERAAADLDARPGCLGRPGCELRAYRCTACGLWHVGNAPAGGIRLAGRGSA